MKNFTLIIFALCATLAHAQAPKLSSWSTAQATIYIDFDGQSVQSAGWRYGAYFECAPSGLNATQITEVYNRVAEDFRPFNINITTDSTVFLAAPVGNRIRIIVTPTSDWYTGVGGVSYIGSFTWGDDTPGFVFTDRLLYNPKFIAECCSHESGHTLGLAHQSAYDNNCNLTQTYSLGAGTGETSWAPVMGNSYYSNMTGWNDGPTPYGCTSTQDNLTTIVSLNGFVYRNDDYNEVLDENTFNAGTNNFTTEGVISHNVDKDAFRFTMAAKAFFHFEAKPFGLNENNTGANLDVMVKLYDASKTLIQTYNPMDKMNVLFDTTLNAGQYYILISGTGNSNVSDYGSLGSYTLTAVRGALPIRSIALNGKSENNKHILNWNIIADEPIKMQTLEVSEDGINFTTLTLTNYNSRSFSYTPWKSKILYYRLNVVSVIDQQAYSNVIALRKTEKLPPFHVSTLAQTDLLVKAPENFQHALYEANGRLIMKGNGKNGLNHINLQGKPSGIYVLQLISNNLKQTERILRQ